MLTGYKSWIGIGIWAIGAVIVEFLSGTPDAPTLMAPYGRPAMWSGLHRFALEGEYASFRYPGQVRLGQRQAVSDRPSVKIIF